MSNDIVQKASCKVCGKRIYRKQGTGWRHAGHSLPPDHGAKPGSSTDDAKREQKLANVLNALDLPERKRSDAKTREEGISFVRGLKEDLQTREDTARDAVIELLHAADYIESVTQETSLGVQQIRKTAASLAEAMGLEMTVDDKPIADLVSL